MKKAIYKIYVHILYIVHDATSSFNKTHACRHTTHRRKKKIILRILNPRKFVAFLVNFYTNPVWVNGKQ